MGRWFGFPVALALAVLCGCAEGRSEAPLAQPQNKGSKMTQAEPPRDGDAVRELPFSHGRSFSSLDEYLAHLRDYAGPVGQPWYRQIRPGVYEEVSTRVPPGPADLVTREELMRRFGFTR